MISLQVIQFWFCAFWISAENLRTFGGILTDGCSACSSDQLFLSPTNTAGSFLFKIVSDASDWSLMMCPWLSRFKCFRIHECFTSFGKLSHSWEAPERNHENERPLMHPRPSERAICRWVPVWTWAPRNFKLSLAHCDHLTEGLIKNWEKEKFTT